METVRVGSKMGMLAAMAAAMSLGAGPIVQATSRPAPKRQRPSSALRSPNGQSFRSLRRAFNQGWEPPVPDEKAMMRHKWYREKLYWAALRERLGQA